MGISKETATDIAMAYREIETAEALLTSVTDYIDNWRGPADVRDVFGRRVEGLELAVPSSGNSKRLFSLPWSLGKPVIEAHIAAQRALISALEAKARIELGAPAPDDEALEVLRAFLKNKGVIKAEDPFVGALSRLMDMAADVVAKAEGR